MYWSNRNFDIYESCFEYMNMLCLQWNTILAINKAHNINNNNNNNNNSNNNNSINYDDTPNSLESTWRKLSSTRYQPNLNQTFSELQIFSDTFMSELKTT